MWPPPRALAPLALAVAYAAGTQGALDPAALAAPALALAALLVQPAAPTALRLAGHMLFIAVAAALFLHLMPGFHNPLVIPRAPLSPDAVPFSMYLNLDKPLVAFWIILALPPVMTGLDAGRTLRATRLRRGGGARVPDAGAGPGHGRLGPAAGQRLAVAGQQCLAGDAGGGSAVPWLYPGTAGPAVARAPLGRRCRAACAAALFGLAHYAGGWQWMLLAGLAGPPTAWLPPRRPGGGGAGAPGAEHRALRPVHLSHARGILGRAAAGGADAPMRAARPALRPQASAG